MNSLMVSVANKAAKKFGMHLLEVFAVNAVAAAAGELVHALASKLASNGHSCEEHQDGQIISLDELVSGAPHCEMSAQEQKPSIVINVNSNNSNGCAQCGAQSMEGLISMQAHPDDCDCGQCVCMACNKPECECK